MRAMEGYTPTDMTAFSIIVALADQIFNRSYVNRQHFLLWSFASLCLDRLPYIDECYFGTGNKNRKQRHMLDGRLFVRYLSKALCCVLFVIQAHCCCQPGDINKMLKFDLTII